MALLRGVEYLAQCAQLALRTDRGVTPKQEYLSLPTKQLPLKSLQLDQLLRPNLYFGLTPLVVIEQSGGLQAFLFSKKRRSPAHANLRSNHRLC